MGSPGEADLGGLQAFSNASSSLALLFFSSLGAADGPALPCCREEMEHGSDGSWLYHLSLVTPASLYKAGCEVPGKD